MLSIPTASLLVSVNQNIFFSLWEHSIPVNPVTQQQNAFPDAATWTWFDHPEQENNAQSKKSRVNFPIFKAMQGASYLSYSQKTGKYMYSSIGSAFMKLTDLPDFDKSSYPGVHQLALRGGDLPEELSNFPTTTGTVFPSPSQAAEMRSFPIGNISINLEPIDMVSQGRTSTKSGSFQYSSTAARLAQNNDVGGSFAFRRGADVVLLEQSLPSFETAVLEAASMSSNRNNNNGNNSVGGAVATTSEHSQKTHSEIIKELSDEFCQELREKILPGYNPDARIILLCVSTTSGTGNKELPIPSALHESIQQYFHGRVELCPVYFYERASTKNQASSKILAGMILKAVWPLWQRRAHTVAICSKPLAHAMYPLNLNRKTNNGNGNDDDNDEQQNVSASTKGTVAIPRFTFHSVIGNRSNVPVICSLKDQESFRGLVVETTTTTTSSSSASGATDYESACDAILRQYPGQAIILQGRTHSRFVDVLVTEGVLAVNQQVRINSLGPIQIAGIHHAHRDEQTQFITAGMAARLVFNFRTTQLNQPGLGKTDLISDGLITAQETSHGFDVTAHYRQFPNSMYFPPSPPSSAPTSFEADNFNFNNNNNDDDENENDSSRRYNNNNNSRTPRTEPIIDYRLTRKTQNIPKLVQPLLLTIELLPPEKQFDRAAATRAKTTAADRHSLEEARVKQEIDFMKNFFSSVATKSCESTVVASAVGPIAVSAYAPDAHFAYAHVLTGHAGSFNAKKENPFVSRASRTIQLLFTFFPQSAATPVQHGLMNNNRISLPRVWNRDENPPHVRLWSAETGTDKLLAAKVISMVTDFDVVEDFLCPSLPPPCPKLFLSKKTSSNNNNVDGATSLTSQGKHQRAAKEILETIRFARPPGCRAGVGFSSPLNEFYIKNVPDHLFLENINPSSWTEDRIRLQWSNTKWGRYALETKYAPFPVCLARLSSVAVAWKFDEIVSNLTNNFEDGCAKSEKQGEGADDDDDDDESLSLLFHPLLPGILKSSSSKQFSNFVEHFAEYLRTFLLPSCGLNLPQVPPDVASMGKQIPAILDACCISMFAWHGAHSGPIFSTSSSSSTFFSPFREELFRIAETMNLAPQLMAYQYDSKRTDNLFSSVVGFSNCDSLNAFGCKGPTEHAARWLSAEDFLGRLPARLLRMPDEWTLLSMCLVGSDSSAVARRMNVRQKVRSTGVYKSLFHEALLVQAVRTANLELIEQLVEALVHLVLSRGGKNETSGENLVVAGFVGDENNSNNHNKSTYPLRLFPSEITSAGPFIPLLVVQKSDQKNKDDDDDAHASNTTSALFKQKTGKTKPNFDFWKDVLLLFNEAIEHCFPTYLASSAFASVTPLACSAASTFQTLLFGCARIALFIKEFSPETAQTIPKLMSWIDVNNIRAPKLRLQMSTTVNRFTRLMGYNVCRPHSVWLASCGLATTVSGISLPNAPLSAVYAELMKILCRVLVEVKKDDHHRQDVNVALLPWEVCQRILMFLIWTE